MIVLTKSMKWAAVAALFAMILLPAATVGTTGGILAVNFVICSAAVLAVFEGAFSRRYVQATTFLIIAALFNPIRPLIRTPGTWWVEFVTAAVFLSALSFWRIREIPRLSMPSITDRNPGSESL